MQSLNILIIEDKVLTANDLKGTLEKAGHHITAIARSYPEAIAAFKRKIPDLILLDIQLAGSQDGVAVAREVLQQQQVPIIVLTANTEDETYLRVKETFIPAAYLTKPFRQPDLTRIVDLAWQNFRPEETTQDSFFLPIENGYEKIVKSEVLYITTKKGTHNVYIFEVYKKEPRLIQLSMGHLQPYFNLPHFFRLSRSLLINLNFIERIEGSQLKIQDNAALLPIPETSRVELLKHLAIIKRPRK
jgi:CheY-like chemotaxis protein